MAAYEQIITVFSLVQFLIITQILTTTATYPVESLEETEVHISTQVQNFMSTLSSCLIKFTGDKSLNKVAYDAYLQAVDPEFKTVRVLSDIFKNEAKGSDLTIIPMGNHLKYLKYRVGIIITLDTNTISSTTGITNTIRDEIQANDSPELYIFLTHKLSKLKRISIYQDIIRISGMSVLIEIPDDSEINLICSSRDQIELKLIPPTRVGLGIENIQKFWYDQHKNQNRQSLTILANLDPLIDYQARFSKLCKPFLMWEGNVGKSRPGLGTNAFCTFFEILEIYNLTMAGVQSMDDMFTKRYLAVDFELLDEELIANSQLVWKSSMWTFNPIIFS